MATENGELRHVAWSEAFPFVRLFSTFRHAIAFWPLVLGMLSVLCAYVSGRVLDRIWLAADGGALVRAEVTESEIAVFSRFEYAEYQAWALQMRERQARSQGEREAAAEDNASPDEALALIEQRLNAKVSGLIAERDELGSANETRRTEINAAIEEAQLAADRLRFHLRRLDPDPLTRPMDVGKAASVLLDPEGIAPAQQAEDMLVLQTAVANAQRGAGEIRVKGPFILLLKHSEACFAAAIRGAANGRLGFEGDVAGREPAMVGSIVSAGSGVAWLVTQRPLYALIFGAILLVNFAFFGGAITRYVAVRTCRDELISFSDATGFASKKWGSMLSAPALLLFGFFFVLLLLLVGGLIGAIPGLQIVNGLLFPLTIFGGFAAALALVILIVALPLMWPPIAVESSDAFHGIQSSAGYVLERPWHYAFYAILLLVYGAFCFVIVRLFALLTFKLAHAGTAAGMNVSTSAETATVGKLDAMWHMPAWSEISLLPTIGKPYYWGDFFNAPLSGAEWVAAVLMAIPVFLGVALVGGFVVSFYFAGATQMYLLLRRDVDGVDYDEIYFEEYDDDLEFDEPAADHTETGEAAVSESEADRPADTTEQDDPPRS